MLTPRGMEKRDRSLLLLVVVGIFLAFRAQGAVQAVLQTQSQLQHSGSPAPSADRGLLSRLGTKDSLLSLVGAAVHARDPFSLPSLARPVPPPAATRPVPEERPAVRLLLYDHTSPLVVLSLGSDTSDRLQQGDRFHGWEVVSIRPGSVAVSRNGETLVLTSP